MEMKIDLKFDDKLYRSINPSFPSNEVYEFKSTNDDEKEKIKCK